ncbi:14 kDa phosphohistidine phosphatase [Biomphalaria glabrata]|uniref:14 kDa phosphohistidine phosphatase-like n=2 Tax=Biomphalaria TaxID=6525 RepID=A0A2C9L2R8_BIOGL|nr:14 kDa phosphohistidine phosphatase-like [Biomphalaria glabrata]XP_055869791.1 14 kDa phosphohistidine phosphatase-like [Biomphalaria glabrata]XP_055869792.1 14 kDa phosphohistidine phosphatase-like [Biomphalaria glabrata]KAI8739039.1 14 kDa phosphohistidine phosphatase-like [Biomphalaria glabrata]KAI8761382.1 14 kDa phosphohistidine phosphatase [Biomphalaria glabrata]
MPGRIAEVNPLLASIEDVAIDDIGCFKYILCKVYQDGSKEDHKMIVRGTKQAEFHADIYDHLDASLEEIGVTCECVGGGKIEHDSLAKTITVFGYSQGYGKADHSVTVRLLKEKYPDYNSITWKDN